MRKKAGIILTIVILICIMFGSQKAGERLYGKIAGKKDAETTGEVKQQTVVIDAGHGGSDPGKVGVNNALEKEINLEIAKKLQKELEAQGVTVVMTREEDNGLAESKVEDLKTRVDIINREAPVLAVSVHQNSYPQEQIQGAQVFYYTHSEGGKAAAEIMQETLKGVNAENRRQAKANDTYYLLKKTEPPIIIVECGFLSNQEEAGKLITEEYQEKLADVIAEGIIKYISEKK